MEAKTIKIDNVEINTQVKWSVKSLKNAFGNFLTDEKIGIAYKIIKKIQNDSSKL